LQMWTVLIVEEFEPEFTQLPSQVQDSILTLTRLLQQFGPQLGRPRVDTLKDSKHANMKELRFDAADGVWHMAFAFDIKRAALLLVAGNKSGTGQARFCRELIRKADERFDAHLDRLKQKEKAKTGKAIREEKWTMARDVNEIIDALPAARRRRIERRASELIREEMTLQQLRRARAMTQVKLAKRLGVAQKQVSEIEKRTDMHISTLRRSIEALGGKLSLIAEFPDRNPVALSGISSLDD